MSRAHGRIQARVPDYGRARGLKPDSVPQGCWWEQPALLDGNVITGHRSRAVGSGRSARQTPIVLHKIFRVICLVALVGSCRQSVSAQSAATSYPNPGRSRELHRLSLSLCAGGEERYAANPARTWTFRRSGTNAATSRMDRPSDRPCPITMRTCGT